MNRWKIGEVSITRVVEMETTSKARGAGVVWLYAAGAANARQRAR